MHVRENTDLLMPNIPPTPEPGGTPGRRPARKGDRGQAATLPDGTRACVDCGTPLTPPTSSPFCSTHREAARKAARLRNRTRANPLAEAALETARTSLLDEPHTTGTGWVTAPSGVYLHATVARTIRADLGRAYSAVLTLEHIINRPVPRLTIPELLAQVTATREALAVLAQHTEPFDPRPQPIPSEAGTRVEQHAGQTTDHP